jgi:hypothetical protein
VVVETPQLGHATYVFAKPRNLDTFLALYTKITKDDIRRNRNNAAERLGFLGRVIHGTNPRAWLKEVRKRRGGDRLCNHHWRLNRETDPHTPCSVSALARLLACVVLFLDKVRSVKKIY